MFAQLIKKELLLRLLDFRFLAVFAMCSLLAGASVYVGGRNYARQVQEYSAVSESNRQTRQSSIVEPGSLGNLSWSGVRWNRPPVPLSPIVYGLTGTTGHEMVILYRGAGSSEAAPFESDPIRALFLVLDLSFIVKIVLSLAVLIFTYDTVCGEKELGTLRLNASFPVPRAAIAGAKLLGSAIAVLIPLVIAFLLSIAVLAASPDVELEAADAWRLPGILGVFILYLLTFVAFGAWGSALTHRRGTAFLGLLLLWTLWVFVVPNLAVDLSRWATPVQSFYELEAADKALRWRIGTSAQAEIHEWEEAHPVADWSALTDEERQRFIDAHRQASSDIDAKWDGEYATELQRLQLERRNQSRRQRELSTVLSGASPLGAMSQSTMDIAGTGPIQTEAIGDAILTYQTYLNGYIQRKQKEITRSYWSDVDLSDFAMFDYRNRDEAGEVLGRNAFHVLNLVLLVILGFAGAFVALLRYDVR